mgnify:FL=1
MSIESFDLGDVNKTLRVDWVCLGRGVWMLMAWHEQWPVPVGTVTFLPSGANEVTNKKKAEILDSNILPKCRRQGVRTWLQKQLFEHWSPDVVISQGSNDQSAKWMEKVGYVIDDTLGCWVVTKENFEKATSGV